MVGDISDEMESRQDQAPERKGPLCPGSLALTFPQLIAQAINLRMDHRDLVRLRPTYDLAERLVDGLYRPEGRPSINHLVRTASILMAQAQSIQVVIGGMLHAAYLRGENARLTDREYLQEQVGTEVEALVWDYANLNRVSRRQMLTEHLQNLDSCGAERRSALVIKCADELENHLDLGVLYRKHFRHWQRIEQFGNLFVELAIRLGLPDLGQLLRDMYDATLSHSVPEEVISHYEASYELRHIGF